MTHFKHVGIALFDLVSILMAFFISLETFESFTELPFHVVFEGKNVMLLDL